MIIRYRNPASFFIFAAGFGLTFLITALLAIVAAISSLLIKEKGIDPEEKN